MLYGFIGRVSNAPNLKQALDAGSMRTRLIADRVAKATLQNQDGFQLPAVGAEPGSQAQGELVDVEAEMVSLADEQLRYETTARLLQKAYQGLRNAIQSR